MAACTGVHSPISGEAPVSQRYLRQPLEGCLALPAVAGKDLPATSRLFYSPLPASPKPWMGGTQQSKRRCRPTRARCNGGSATPTSANASATITKKTGLLHGSSSGPLRKQRRAAWRHVMTMRIAAMASASKSMSVSVGMGSATLPTAVAVPLPAAAAPVDIAGQLERVAALKEKGMLNEVLYEAAVAKILEMSALPPEPRYASAAGSTATAATAATAAATSSATAAAIGVAAAAAAAAHGQRGSRTPGQRVALIGRAPRCARAAGVPQGRGSRACGRFCRKPRLRARDDRGGRRRRAPHSPIADLATTRRAATATPAADHRRAEGARSGK